MSAPVSLGRMRRRVTFQNAILTPDGQGGDTLLWQDAAALWGELRGLGGAGLRLREDEPLDITRHELVVRQGTPLAPGMRALIDGEPYSVITVLDPTGAGRFYYILLEKGGPQ